MKLLYIINSLESGGAEKLVTDMAMVFNTKKIKVTILLLNGKQTPLYNNVKKNSPIKIISLGKNKSIYNPLYSFKIKRIMNDFNIIHVHLFPSSYWVALANILSFKNNNIIFTEHNTTNRRRSKPIFKYIDRVVYKQFKTIVTISDAVDKSLKIHLGKGFHNILKIYNGIHIEKFSKAVPYKKEELGFINNEPLIIQVASFTTQKDQKTAIKALLSLPAQIQLLLVGNGPLLDATKAYAKQLNLIKRVHFMGIREDVPRLLKTADIVLLSSYYEGLSLSCIEGMASSRPFIASDSPGLGDIVNKSGLIFQIGNAVKLAEIIKNLLDDALLYKNTSKSCIKKSLEFDISLMINRHLELYNNYK